MGLRVTNFGFKGLAFYASMVLAFFAAPYSNLFFLLLGFLTLQWAVGVIATLRNVAGLELQVRRFAPQPAGQPGLLQFELTGNRRQRFQLELRLELEGQDEVVERIDVFTDHVHADLELPPLARGIYGVKRARLASCYPFGFLRASSEVEVPGELLVHPAPSSSGRPVSTRGALAEILAPAPSTAGQLQPAGLRDYRNGDDPRSVHWRSSARRGRLVVAEWDESTDDSHAVVLDRRCSKADLEGALARLTAVAFQAFEQGRPLVVQTQGLSDSFGPGARPELELVRFLCVAEILPDTESGPGPARPGALVLPQTRRTRPEPDA